VSVFNSIIHSNNDLNDFNSKFKFFKTPIEFEIGYLYSKLDTEYSIN
jgi:hypothetical protein